MIENFFRHRCQVFSGTMETVNAGYGLPSSDVNIEYKDVPTYDGLMCFFGNSNNPPKITLSEPVNIFDGFNEVSLPAGTIVSKGDKIVDMRFDISYTAGFPENVRDKYISVPIYRTAAQEKL